MSEGNSLHANLVKGLDGDLYGTAYGSVNGNGTVFRVSKDGATFAVVYDFSGFDGRGPFAPLLVGQDGAFYGTTQNGGDLGFGVVFRLLPPQAPEMLGVQVLDTSLKVVFSGTSGLQYQLLHSPHLTHWALLTPVSMPASGISTNVIPAPLDPSGLYRAAWIP